jgi:hypothetical protein
MNAQEAEISERFNSLMRVQVKKKRSCLKCGKVYMSESTGDRICCFCQAENKRISGSAQGMSI